MAHGKIGEKPSGGLTLGKFVPPRTDSLSLSFISLCVFHTAYQLTGSLKEAMGNFTVISSLFGKRESSAYSHVFQF